MLNLDKDGQQVKVGDYVRLSALLADGEADIGVIKSFRTPVSAWFEPEGFKLYEIEFTDGRVSSYWFGAITKLSPIEVLAEVANCED